MTIFSYAYTKNDGFFFVFFLLFLFFYDEEIGIFLFLVNNKSIKIQKPTIRTKRNLNFINGILLKNLRTAINFNYSFYRYFSCN